MEPQRIVIITGLSGSGKSTAIKALEDIGFFCIDNLPFEFLPQCQKLRLGLSNGKSDGNPDLALVMDIRQQEFVLRYSEAAKNLRSHNAAPELVFLEASDQELLRRYSETRRRHPLAGERGISDAIRKEREQLRPLREIADKVIDTSHHNVHELKRIVVQYVQKELRSGALQVRVMSFGFKYGIPAEADLVADIRFLPNPYFVPELTHIDGTSPQVQAFVNKSDETKLFLEKYLALLSFLIPLYEKQGRASLTIAVGCTGGRHRSVVVANEIFIGIKQSREGVYLTHRDIELG